MTVLRTPDERFAQLADYPWTPHYVDVDGLRMHYLDEGPRDAPIVLCVHGEPTWSYLYRKMIPPLCHAGLRVIAPDLIGFGRSDKPTAPEAYSYQQHVDWLAHFLTRVELGPVHLFCQDWGGLIALRLVAEEGDRFERVVASNTALPTGDYATPEAFFVWQRYVRESPTFSVGATVARMCAQPTPALQAAYDAPFPDERYQVGARVFPSLVPTSPNDPASAKNRAAWAALRQRQQPFLTLFGDGDPFTKGADRVFCKLIPGAAGQPHQTLAGCGHFSQEDAGPELAARVARFLLT